MKYIIFERPDLMPHVVIFDARTDHAEMARLVDMPVISAGQVSFQNHNCINGSTTLKKVFNDARSDEDDAIVKRLRDM